MNRMSNTVPNAQSLVPSLSTLTFILLQHKMLSTARRSGTIEVSQYTFWWLQIECQRSKTRVPCALYTYVYLCSAESRVVNAAIPLTRVASFQSPFGVCRPKLDGLWGSRRRTFVIKAFKELWLSSQYLRSQSRRPRLPLDFLEFSKQARWWMAKSIDNATVALPATTIILRDCYRLQTICRLCRRLGACYFVDIITSGMPMEVW